MPNNYLELSTLQAIDFENIYIYWKITIITWMIPQKHWNPIFL